jgi:hypothetical protein
MQKHINGHGHIITSDNAQLEMGTMPQPLSLCIKERLLK